LILAEENYIIRAKIGRQHRAASGGNCDSKWDPRRVA
jgi:hypothetical protein